MGRYPTLGLVALPLAWLGCARLRQLGHSDWWTVLGLTMMGNLIYYACLASAIQRTGAPVPTMIIGTLPAVLPVLASLLYSRCGGKLPWRCLFPTLVHIAVSLICVSVVGLHQGLPDFSSWRYGFDIALTLGSVARWAWYALRNVRWLRENPHQSSMMWTAVQTLVTLPTPLTSYLVACIWLHSQQVRFPLSFSPHPIVFAALMLTITVLCLWVDVLRWNIVSQRLPTVILGPLIIFETLAGLLYTFLLRQSLSPLLTLSRILPLVFGVVSAVRARPEKPVLQPLTDEKKQPDLLRGHSLAKKMHLKYILRS